MDPSIPSASQDASVNFWSDHANIEDLHYRVLMGEKVHVPPRPGCNLSPDWSFPQALAQMEQVTRRPSPTGTPSANGQTPRVAFAQNTSNQGPPNISSLHVSGTSESRGPKPGSSAFSPRRPLYTASPRSQAGDRLRPGLYAQAAPPSARVPHPKPAEPLRQRPLSSVAKPTSQPLSVSRSEIKDSFATPMPHQTPDASTVRSLFPNFKQDRKPEESPMVSQAAKNLPSNGDLVGKKHERAEATLIRLRNQRPIDPDMIFGTANFEVPLKKIFVNFKEAALFVNNDHRGISGDWNRDIYDDEEEFEYKQAVGIQNLPSQ